MTSSMTSGSPLRHILSFFFPMLAGMIFQQLYNLVDAAIVGQLLGASALAAVGSTGSITFLVIGFCMGICSGFSIPVAQRFGAADNAGMRRMVGTSVHLSVYAAVLLTLATTFLCRRILSLMHTPDDIFTMAYDYLLIIFAAIPATIAYNLLSGILRSLGDSRTPVVFLVVSSVLNILLDLLFILVFHSGVAGAAWATLLAQAISALGCLGYIRLRCPILHLSRDDLRFRAALARPLCYNGIPMGLQYSVTAIGSAVLQSSINGLGTASVAGATAGMKVARLLETPFDALGATMSTYCGQNAGAKTYHRLGRGIISASVIGGVYSILAFLAMLVYAQPCCLVFLNASETEILALAAQYLVYTAAFFIPLMLVNVVRFAIQGMGFSILAVTAGVMELIGRALTGLFLVPRLGFTGACLGSPLAWVAADAFLIPACVICIRRLKAGTLSARPGSSQR